MKFSTYLFSPSEGWNQPLDKGLDSVSTLVFTFGGSDRETLQDGLDALQKTYPQSVHIGCSTAGEIYGEIVHDDTLSVAVMCLEHGRVRQKSLPVSSVDDSIFIGRELAEKLLDDDLKAVFVLSDGLLVNGSKLVEGFMDVLPANIVVTGGLAGDGSRFESTWILGESGLHKAQVSAVGLYGDRIRVQHGSRGGWDVLQSELRVTHAIGNVLYELDERSALDVYKEHMGDQADQLPASGLLFPLAIKNERASDGYTVRTILAVDEDEESITFAGNIPEGRKVQLMHANFEGVVNGASSAAELATQSLNGEPVLGIAISCVGRRLVLAEQTPRELRATAAHYPPGSAQVGFYSYGEISPLASGRCDLHNQTMTLTLFSET